VQGFKVLCRVRLRVQRQHNHHDVQGASRSPYDGLCDVPLCHNYASHTRRDGKSRAYPGIRDSGCATCAAAGSEAEGYINPSSL